MPTGEGLKLVRVLIVEADGSIRLLLGRLVAGHGYSPVPAGTGGTAMILSELDPPQVALVDDHLPDMRGAALIARWRASADRRLHRVSIVGLASTAAGSAELLAAGADRVVRKPLRAVALRRTIDRLLGVHRVPLAGRLHRPRSTACAACQPHMPWTPPPGGVEAEQR